MLLSILFACAGTPDAPVEAPADAPATPQAPAGSTRDVDIATFASDRDAGKVPVVVDVRTQKEWDGGHVPGAVHIPMDEIEGRLAELDSYKAGDVYLICQSGGRSGRVAKTLAASGYSAVNVDGGTGGWIDAGHPVE